MPHTVKFVSEIEAGRSPSADMLHAFQLSKENNENVTWISSTNILEMNKDTDSSSIFVCENFAGDTYGFLKKREFRIYGPRYIISCIQQGVAADQVEWPICNAVMKGLFVCFTNVAHDRRSRMYDKVKLMGGRVKTTFTEEVTHLVADQASSKKYHLASAYGKPIYTTEWIDRCWHNGKTEFCHATDAVFKKYLCPTFKNLNITVSQVSAVERNKIKSVVEANGGKYAGCLKVNVTTHLVLNDCSGDKYKMAKSKKIACVKPEWIYDSVKKGYCLDEQLYSLATDNKNESDVYNVTSSTRTMNETYLSTTMLSEVKQVKEKENDNERSTISLDYNKLKAAGQFLDGCKVVLYGFVLTDLENLKKILNRGGATRYDHINENVTHVIIGKASEEEKKKLLEGSFRPHVVNELWLKKCLDAGKMVEEDEFSCYEFPAVEINISQQQKQLPTVNLSQNSKLKTQGPESPVDVKSFDDVLSQYLPSSVVDKEKHLFADLKFGVFGFDEYVTVKISNFIIDLGGFICSDNETVDYAITPIHTVQVSVNFTYLATYYWLQCCIEDKCLHSLSDHPLYIPLDIEANQRCLEHCVLSTSQFQAEEKDVIAEVVVLLGARFQEQFSKVTTESQGILACTHLIANQPTGRKYEAAISWGIPVVNLEWLVECAYQRTKVDVKPFLLNTVKGNDSEIKFSATSTPKQKITIDTPENMSTPSNSTHDDTLDMKAFLKTPDVMKSILGRLNNSLNEERMDKIKERLKNGYMTPIAQNISIKKLIDDDKTLNNSSTSDCESSYSPSKFLPENPFPKPILREMKHNLLDSPLTAKPSTELRQREFDKMFSKAIRKAYKDDVKRYGQAAELSSESSGEEDSFIKGPLNGITIVVGKNFAESQEGLNRLAESLGAKCRWKYDQKCTHFIHEGSVDKEARQALKDSKFVISREWLYACRDGNIRAKEEDFPHFYDSKLTLSISKVQKSLLDVSKSFMTPPKMGGSTMLSDMEKLLAAAKVVETKRNVKTTSNVTVNAFKEGVKKPPSNPRKGFNEEDSVCMKFESVPITWEVSSGCKIKADNSEMNHPPTFLLAGFSTSEKMKYQNILTSLDDEALLETTLNSKITHLLTKTMSFTEKSMAGMASGLWILKPSYLDACAKVGKLVKEDEHEWGLDENDPTLAIASRKWRIKLSKMRQRGVEGVGAFSNWRVVIYTEPSRCASFQRILSAGGAEIVEFSPNSAHMDGITHVFIEQDKVSLSDAELTRLAGRDSLCLKLQYISAYLQNEEVSIDDYLIPEIENISLLKSNGKRSSDENMDKGKRCKNNSQIV